VDDPITQTLVRLYVDTLVSLKRWPEAREAQERVVAHCERTKGERDPETTLAAWHLLQFAQAGGDDEAAQSIIAGRLMWLLFPPVEGLDPTQNQIRVSVFGPIPISPPPDAKDE
jgi:hypothetical protein